MLLPLLLLVLLITTGGWNAESKVLGTAADSEQHDIPHPIILKAYLPDYSSTTKEGVVALHHLNQTACYLTDLVAWSFTPLSNGSISPVVVVVDDTDMDDDAHQRQGTLFEALRQARVYNVIVRCHIQQHQRIQYCDSGYPSGVEVGAMTLLK